MPAMKSLEDAFVTELQDVLHAEKQITKALPRMAKKASHEELKRAFEEHLHQTEEQIERLEQCFHALGKNPRTKTCEGMKGLIEEGKEHMGEKAEPDTLDAILIESAQKVEHYEIASYGTLCTWAEMLGHQECVDLLKQTLAEEKETDQKLTRIAEQIVNRDALVGAEA